MGLDKAIKHGYLAQYKFFPRVTYLTGEEMNKYFKISRQIAIEKNKRAPDVKKNRKVAICKSRDN